MQLTSDLEERALARFDELVKQEKIFYEQPPSELVRINGFDVSSVPPYSYALVKLDDYVCFTF